MPTVLREGPYRFYFFSDEGREPAHVHVDREACSAKFWLSPVRVARNIGFPPAELRRIRRRVEERRDTLMQAWHGHFGAGSR